ncbi:MAG: hypothetical protein M0Z28_22470 [Rhodospirillales bacterium]|nr:hypothetical protein [Rhodospirillales bacterium]
MLLFRRLYASELPNDSPDLLPPYPTDPPGLHKAQTSVAWLTHEMERRDISNLELYRRLRAAGLRGVSTNIISLWRTDKTAITPETLPLLLEALEMPPQTGSYGPSTFFTPCIRLLLT